MKRLMSAIAATVGLTGLAISGFPLAAQSARFSQIDFGKIPASPEQLFAQRRERSPSWWQSLIFGERRDGGRDPFAEKYLNERLCVVSPNNISIGSWSDQPLLVWLDKDNAFDRVEVYAAGTREPAWKQSVAEMRPEDGWYILSPDLVFEKGSTYYFALRKDGEEGRPNPAERIKIAVLTEEEKAPVSAALEMAGLTGNVANFETLRFFANQSGTRSDGERVYFLDMARVLFSMPASAEKSAYINEIVDTYCRPLPEVLPNTPFG